MEIRIVVDRAQALWAAQQTILKEFPKRCNGQKPPASLLHTIWQGIINSPAYALPGINVIYLQSKIPEEYLPMILNHEELHLLYYQIVKEDSKDGWKASLACKHIDNPKLNRWLCDLFDLDHRELYNYLKDYVIRNLPIIRQIVALKRWLCNR